MSPEMETHFGEWFRQRRQALGLSAYQVAAQSGFSRNLISKFELGKQAPSDNALEKLAPVLGVSFEDLKRETLKDRLTDHELQAAAEIAAEEATPADVANIVRVHFRAKAIPPEKRKAYLQDLARYIKAIDEHWDEL